MRPTKLQKLQPNEKWSWVEAISSTKKKASHKPCHKCGDEHIKGNCPVKYATCYFCKKIGHYAKVCRKKLRKVNEMTQDDSSDDMNAYNLGEIGTITTTMRSVNNESAKLLTTRTDTLTRSTRGLSSMAVMTSSWKSKQGPIPAHAHQQIYWSHNSR